MITGRSLENRPDVEVWLTETGEPPGTAIEMLPEVELALSVDGKIMLRIEMLPDELPASTL